jgi:hypothetical protein
MKYSITILYFYLLFFIDRFSYISGELKFVFEIFRHGAREPLESQQNNSLIDIFNEVMVGNGELTPVGMRQHYLLGKSLRKRYPNFISENYNVHELLVYSTDTNRTLTSAYSHLQGLFSFGTGPALQADQISKAVPPVNSQLYQSEISSLGNSALPDKMQVIPVHIFKSDFNSMYLYNDKNCPGVSLIFEKNKNKKIIVDFLNNFNNTWGSKLKIPLNTSEKDYFLDYNNVVSITDTFVCDITNGKKLQILENVGIDLNLLNKTAYEFLKLDMLESLFGDEESLIAKFSTSLLAHDILSFMDKKIDIDRKVNFQQNLDPKLVIYSGHDVNLAGVQTYLKALFNLTNLFSVPFASNILFELHSKDGSKDNYFVNVIYNDMNILTLDYTSFKEKIIENYYDTDKIMSICKVPNLNNISHFYKILSIIFIVISCILLFLIIWLLLNKNEGKDFCYKPLPQEDTNKV